MNLFQSFRDLRIQRKLLVGYSTVFILCIVLGSLVVYSVVRQTLETNIESELKNTTTTILNMVRTSAATSIKNHLRAVAEKNLDIATYFHGQALTGRLTEDEARERVTEILLSQPIGTTGYIYCIDSAGVMNVHPKQELIKADLSEYAFIREQTVRKEGYLEYDWMNPGETRARPKALYMTYFEPWDWIISVSSYREEFRELVNVEDFRESILALQFGQTGYSYIIDEQGNMVLHPQVSGNYLHAKDRNGQEFIREICARKSGKITYSWENPGENKARDKLVIFNHIPEYQWIVASSSYLDEFYAPLTTMHRLILATVVMSFIIVLPLTLTISNSITTPLTELMNHFSSGAAGNYRVRMKRRSRDEIGRLANYFNQFMERLEAYSNSLKSEIRERERAEEAIRESEAKYRELVENANSIILRLSTVGEITFFNEFAQKFFGYAEQDILGRPILGALIPAVDSTGENLSEETQHIYTSPENHPGFETEAIRQCGERAWISWTNRAIRDDQDALVGCLWIGNDVTAARKAEQEMVRLQHYLASIIDSMPSVLVGVDRWGRVTQWNREAEKATGVSSRDARNQNLERIYPLLRPLNDMVKQAIHERTVRQAEKVAYQTGDQTRYADIMIYPLDIETMEGAVIRVDDVTARVRMENTMVQTEKMLSVGGLAAGMAHEINNPLSGILQSAQNIVRRLDPALEKNNSIAAKFETNLDSIRAYLDERGITRFIEGIRQSGERASTTVSDMLHFSRPSDSRMVPASLTELVDKTVALAAHDYDLRKKYDFREIEIVRDFEDDLPLVPCVATELGQVILNLLRNASQAFGPAQPPVEAPCITLRLRRDRNFIRLEVEDNGPGMDEETRKRVFEPFFTTKEVGVGTGLGLSVSYFIVTSHHGGTMAVDSAPGQGARFTLRLPLAGSPPPANRP
jgi:two-component system, NtrC family, sensor kinase